MTTNPSRYRKRPVEVDAIQFDGSLESGSDVLEFVNGRDQQGAAIFAYDTTVPVVYINTLEGQMTASPGDYIIRGVQGEFYPCKPEIFDATHDKVGVDNALDALKQAGTGV